MTVSVSLKLENQTFVEINEIVKGTNISRNKYINEALKYYNKLKKRSDHYPIKTGDRENI